MTAPPKPVVLLTVDETAAELHCHPRTVRKLLELEELRRVDLNRHAVRVTRSSLDAFLERGGSTA